MKEKTDAYITPNNKHFSFIFKIMPISVDLFNLFHNPFLALYGGIQGFKALKRRVLINNFFFILVWSEILFFGCKLPMERIWSYWLKHVVLLF